MNWPYRYPPLGKVRTGLVTVEELKLIRDRFMEELQKPSKKPPGFGVSAELAQWLKELDDDEPQKLP